jgi:4-oxalomesaconate hydratase
MTSLVEGTLVVVSAHSADFVWRAGGALAAHTSNGGRAHVICLSFGERGESAKLWRQPGMTLDGVKAARKEEATNAAEALGSEVSFFDAGDYPLPPAAELVDRLAAELRSLAPAAILTHAAYDPYNTDHADAYRMTLQSRMVAQAHGFQPEDQAVLGAPPVFVFEPHQPEVCEFRPDLLLDITHSFPQKRKAMECMAAQEHLWRYYTDLAERRGVQAVRNSGNKAIVHAEAYQRVFPTVASVLS